FFARKFLRFTSKSAYYSAPLLVVALACQSALQGFCGIAKPLPAAQTHAVKPNIVEGSAADPANDLERQKSVPSKLTFFTPGAMPAAWGGHVSDVSGSLHHSRATRPWTMSATRRLVLVERGRLCHDSPGTTKIDREFLPVHRADT